MVFVVRSGHPPGEAHHWWVFLCDSPEAVTECLRWMEYQIPPCVGGFHWVNGPFTEEIDSREASQIRWFDGNELIPARKWRE